MEPPVGLNEVEGLQHYEPQFFIYFLVLGLEVVYVGQTNDLKQRIDQHRRGFWGGNRKKQQAKTFDDVFYIPVAEEDADRLEAYWIDRLRPRLNLNLKPFRWKSTKETAAVHVNGRLKAVLERCRKSQDKA